MKVARKVKVAITTGRDTVLLESTESMYRYNIKLKVLILHCGYTMKYGFIIIADE